MDKPPPYSPPEGPIASAPYAPYTAYTATAQPYPQSATPFYPTGPGPYPQASNAGPPPQIGFVIPGSTAPSYSSYTVPQTTIVVQQPAQQVSVVHFGRHPVMTTCPSCGHYGLTKTTSESGCLAWLLCGLLCLFGLWFGCCLIPFCIDSVKNVKHTCAKCRRRVGHYAPI